MPCRMRIGAPTATAHRAAHPGTATPSGTRPTGRVDARRCVPAVLDPSGPSTRQDEQAAGQYGQRGHGRRDRRRRHAAVAVRACGMHRRRSRRYGGDPLSSRKPANRRLRRAQQPRLPRCSRDVRKHLLLGTCWMPRPAKAKAIRHHHEQPTPVGRRQLEPEESGIQRRLSPQRSDRPQVVVTGDDRHPDREPRAVRSADRREQVPLCRRLHALL